MVDRVKVIKGLEYCMGGCQVSCSYCPYRDIGDEPPDCLDNCRILHDALELLKEQNTCENVVRCKNCSFHSAGENEVDAWNRCLFHSKNTNDENYCSWGVNWGE